MKRTVLRESLAGNPIPPLPCACANLRRASRMVTQLYDEELRPAAMRATQFTLLQALIEAKNISQGALGEVLGLDSTTLTRTLALLRKRGWVRASPGEDRRQVQLALTSKGIREYRRARRYWLSAQERLRAALGEVRWNRILDATIGVASQLK